MSFQKPFCEMPPCWINQHSWECDCYAEVKAVRADNEHWRRRCQEFRAAGTEKFQEAKRLVCEVATQRTACWNKASVTGVFALSGVKGWKKIHLKLTLVDNFRHDLLCMHHSILYVFHTFPCMTEGLTGAKKTTRLLGLTAAALWWTQNFI